MSTTNESYDVPQMLVLRKLTKAVAEHLHGLLRNYLAALAPLMRPRSVFGDYIHGGLKEIVKGADKAFKDLQNLYETTASSKPFQLPRELNSPFEVLSSTAEMNPVESLYTARTALEEKKVMISAPLKWIITYSGFSPARLKELLDDRNRNSKELQEFILHYLILHVVFSKQTGLTQILHALHFPVTKEYVTEFGSLPLTCICSSISTVCPPDALIIESTELSGRNVFEQIVHVDDILKMKNPLKEELIQIVRNHNPALLSD